MTNLAKLDPLSRVSSLGSLVDGDMGSFSAPIFGTNSRADPKDIDLNEVFQDYFLMSEFDSMSPKSARASAERQAVDEAEEAEAGSENDDDYRESGAEKDHQYENDGESSPSSEARATRTLPARAAAVAASAAWSGTHDETEENEDVSKSIPNTRPSQDAVSTRKPARKATVPAPKKPKLQPSGFAGISAIATAGSGGLLTTVKHEPQQGVKKRRRRPDPRLMTDDQRVERRERNREHAKRSRIRKKFLLESLQQQLNGLRSENTGLRGIVKRDLPSSAAASVLSTCLSEESFSLLDSDLRLAAEETAGRSGSKGGKATGNSGGLAAGAALSRGLPDGVGGKERALTEPDLRLMSSLMHCQQNFTVSDPSLPDNPIVYASEGFLTLTGYTREQVLGRNCRFLQGPKTDQRMVDVIRKGVATGEDTSVCLLNYKQDGTPFWNQFFVAALRDARGNIVNHVGVQCEVNALVAANQGTPEAPTLPEFYGGEGLRSV